MPLHARRVRARHRGDWSGLQQVQLAVSEGPFNILRGVVMLLDQLAQRHQLLDRLFIKAGECLVPWWYWRGYSRGPISHVDPGFLAANGL